MYNSSLGFDITVPEWEAILTSVVLILIILMTLVGNILVILSIFTYRPLKTVQNYFLVSLALADIAVSVFVLPLSVIDYLLGRWKFGKHICKVWLTCDIMCCTASILNLCAIALDRYWAITNPLNYAQKRTLKLVLVMIGGVWTLSAIISSPPLLGWNTWPEVFNETTTCELTTEQGYVVYSSLGSFYIPFFVMTTVYVEIFIATKRRLKQRSRASKLSSIKWSRPKTAPKDGESASSDTVQNESCSRKQEDSETKRMKSLKKMLSRKYFAEKFLRRAANIVEDPVTDNLEESCSEPQCTSPLPKNVSERKNRTNLQMLQAQASDVSKRISLTKERRAARTLGIIMGVFVVCWLPFFLWYVIVPLVDEAVRPSKKWSFFVVWLGYVNSAVNPIIYTVFNMDFRKAFKKLLHIK